ncbi:MAG: hypothetical protein EXR83_11925 [Gammaproteobacteria bacterium]|nr:hypothetical protein [Gammaproteobacteria bacterium]
MIITFPTQPGTHDVVLEAPAGAVARCTVHVPDLPAADAPLVLVLHYGGEPTGFYGRPLLEMLAAGPWRELGAVFVAPVAAGGDWSVPRNCELALNLLYAAQRHYQTADSKRVVLGYSMGAMGVWQLLAKVPDLFAAAVPLAGPPPPLLPTLVLRTPVQALNSQADRLFPASATAAAIAALAAGGAPAQVRLLEGIDHHAFGAFAPSLAQLLPWLRGCWAPAGVAV